MNRIAWHFINADWTTSTGGLLVKVGETIEHAGDLTPCSSGLHASVRAIDALCYSNGPVITLVECEGEFVDHGSPTDKFVCRKRTALWGYDCTDELWTFSRLCALESLRFWPDAPDVVRQFLETGDESLRAAARDVAWDAAWAAARDAAWAAARDVAWDAAWDAARAAAWAAARDVARAAAWAAARDVARDAAWAAARDVAWDAAWDAARAAELDRFNQILESLLIGGAISRGLIP